MAVENKKIKILYVDDEEINLFIFDQLFRDHLDVVSTTSSEEALRLLKRPDNDLTIVIADQKMHPISGLTLASRARHEGITVPFFMLSAFPQTPEIKAALEAGTFNRFFNKPLDVEAILEEIKSFANGSPT